MKYKILKGTETFQKIEELSAKMKAATTAAFDLAKELGGDEIGTHIGLGSTDNLAGGMTGIKMDKQPENWGKAAKKHYTGFYYPMRRIANKDILAKWEALPVIDRSEFNDIIGFKAQFGDCKYFPGVGVEWHKDYILIDCHDEAKFKPNKDTIEILGSEYNKLKHKDK